MMLKARYLYFLLAASIVLGLVACGAPTPTSPPSSTPEPESTATAAPSIPSGQTPGANVPALHDKVWRWKRRVVLDSGKEEPIGDPAKYTLTFKSDGTYQFLADCNRGSGTYTADEKGAIRMEAGPITRAECGPESRDQDVLNMMQAVQDYRLEEDGVVLAMVWPAGGPEDYYHAP
jgi:heat shock protein HslJ